MKRLGMESLSHDLLSLVRQGIFLLMDAIYSTFVTRYTKPSLKSHDEGREGNKAIS
jgi:hypothetical protein